MTKPSKQLESHVSYDLLQELLDYSPDTGIFTWKTRDRKHFATDGRWKTWNARFTDKAAGCLCKTNGYLLISIDDRLYKAHRLAWLYVYGEWPSEQVDHVNRDRSDNRIANLRLACTHINSQNASRRHSNTSGHTGVYWQKRERKWEARVTWHRRGITLGSYKSKTDAILARRIAEKVIGFSHGHGHDSGLALSRGIPSRLWERYKELKTIIEPKVESKMLSILVERKEII